MFLFTPSTAALRSHTARDVDADAEDTMRLQLALINETLNICTLAAVAGSIANAASAIPPRCSVETVREYLPPDPLIWPAIAAGMAGTELDGHMVQSLRRLHRSIVAAKQTCCSHRSALREPAEWRQRALTVAGVWRDAAALGYEALCHIAEAGLARSGDERLFAAIRSLRDVVACKSPFIDANGGVVRPDWTNRRRDQRVVTDLAANVVEAGDEALPVQVVDISTGGMRLVGVHGFSQGERIVIELRGGRQMAGTVAWTNGDTLGLSLDVGLAASDPLLRQNWGEEA